jgi:exopolyphosphatase/guanosine-5'-triphosphate,3'-diphosphate pyrophosphatase
VRVAAVDCGTNSIRLLVADLTPTAADPQPPAVMDLQKKVDVHREMRVVRLGQGVDRTGMLAPEALERTRVAVVDYAATCRELGVERIRFIATSATRDAANRDVFTALVREVLEVDPEVVSGDEEAALSFLGATSGLDAEGPFLVMDIGGGSTELVVGDEKVEAACSVDVGCVRLTERHLHDDPPTTAQVAAARADVEAALEQAEGVVPVAHARTAIGLAGSVTTVAALALELPAYQAERIHLSRISAPKVREVTDMLLAMTRAQRAALPVMHPGRVDVIGGGALVLLTIVERFGLEEVLVSESDILDGIALSLDGGPLA